MKKFILSIVIILSSISMFGQTTKSYSGYDSITTIIDGTVTSWDVCTVAITPSVSLDDFTPLTGINNDVTVVLVNDTETVTVEYSSLYPDSISYITSEGTFYYNFLSMSSTSCDWFTLHGTNFTVSCRHLSGPDYRQM